MEQEYLLFDDSLDAHLTEGLVDEKKYENLLTSSSLTTWNLTV